MIATVKGKLISKKPRCIVNIGGIGLELNVPDKDLEVLEETSSEVSFHTYLHVREDKLALFGFLSREDRELFTRLIEVSGIGPRIALAMLSTNPAGKIISAIKRGEKGFLVSMPGLGRKTVERLVMELKDKLDDIAPPDEEQVPEVSIKKEAVLALTALGMNRVVAERALESVDWNTLNEPSVEEVVREALKTAGGS